MTHNCFTIVTQGQLEYSTAPFLGVPHAFTTRLGGVDGGTQAGLNLGYNRTEQPDAVRENYRILCEALGLDENRLVWGRQVHGRTVLPAEEKDICRLGGSAREGDGVMSNVPGLGLVVYTADCIPILLSDPVTGAVAAIHAGWRGTVADISGEGVRAMARQYGSRPEDIRAAVGPGISQCCFQVGRDVVDAVIAVLGREGEQFISTRPAPPFGVTQFVPPEAVEGKFYVDNKGVNRALLIKAGVAPENIAVSDECTRCDTDRYWSHRFHGDSRGSQGAIIAAGNR